MQSEAPGSVNHQPDKGLPSVVPPSGKHIIQLFVVPGIIVAVALLLLLGVDWLVGGSRTPQDFLEKLNSANPDVRWRAANDLAQVLKRDEQLALDVDFALKTAEKYQQAVNDYEQSERELFQQHGKLSAQQEGQERERLRAKRNYAVYLGSCLGNFLVPVGAPELGRVARQGASGDKETNALFRRQAVWALANLGNNLQRYPQLPEAKRAAAQQELQRQADASTGDRREWAQKSLAYLQYHQPLGVIDALADDALVESDKNPDIFLRELVALALNFWNETPEKNRLAEEKLLVLSRDSGQGEWIYPTDDGVPEIAKSR